MRHCKETHAESNIYLRTTLNPSNYIVKRKIWIIPHSEKNIFELRRYLRDFSRLKIQHFPARCLLFMNNNKDKSYSFCESTALTLSKFGVMIFWIVFPWRPKVSLKYQFHTCLRDLSGSSRAKFFFSVFLELKRSGGKRNTSNFFYT